MTTDAIKVLLVDDHQMMREGLRRLLNEQPDLRVVGDVANGAAALDQVRAAQPHVVVMDVHLSEENGIEISKQLLDEFPELKIVILSADTSLGTVQSALQTGVAGYLTKDTPPEELLQAVRDAVDHRLFLSREISSVVVRDYLKQVVLRAEPAKPVLTEREILLLKLVAQGKRNKEIADALHVGVRSVETYRSRLLHKLNCASTAELTRYAIREGIVSV